MECGQITTSLLMASHMIFQSCVMSVVIVWACSVRVSI